jgi:hypothetical protein
LLILRDKGGNAGIARSKATSTETAARGSETALVLRSPSCILKIVCQQGWIVGKARDAAICVLKYYDVELPAASWNRSGNLTKSSE